MDRLDLIVTTLDVITLSVSLLFLIGMTLIVRIIVVKTIRKNVVPKLKSKAMDFIDFKWLGPFGSGDFPVQKFSFLSTGGGRFLSLYFYIYYKEADLKKRVTIRIDTFFFILQGVFYSKDF